jgi:hypothetical protein
VTTAGTIAPDGSGGFIATGDHTYAQSGSYIARVTISGKGGIRQAVNDAVAIGDLIVPISGTVPGSGLTGDNRPTVTGVAEPFATVSIFAQASGSSTPTLVGTATAGASGRYSVTTSTLADGQYTVMVSAVDRLGKPSSAMTVLYPTATRGPLTVDTQGPRVTSAKFDIRTGKATIQITDELAGLSADSLSESNFSLASSTGQTYHVTAVNVLPGSTSTRETVVVNFATGKKPAKGSYVLTITSADTTDRAGNGLDERYFVPFPGLYNRAGQDYTAAFRTDGRTVAQPTQFIPPNEVVAANRHRLFVRRNFRRSGA